MQHDSSRIFRIGSILAGNTCVFAHDIQGGTLGRICGTFDVSAVHIGTYRLAGLV